MNTKKSFWLLLLILVFFSCNSNDDGNGKFDSNKIGNNNSNKVTKLDVEINAFIWSRLNALYYWQEDVPNLSDEYSKKETLLHTLLQSKKPNEFFYSLLYQYGEVDRFSWIVDDYHKLLNDLNGISKESGMHLQLTLIGDDVVGFVNYVVPDSPAAKAGVKRGDVIYKINGQIMNKK